MNKNSRMWIRINSKCQHAKDIIDGIAGKILADETACCPRSFVEQEVITYENDTICITENYERRLIKIMEKHHNAHLRPGH